MKLSFYVGENMHNIKVHDFLRKSMVSESLIKLVKYLPEGITVDGMQINTDRRLSAGQTVSIILPPEKETTVIAQDIPINIAFENEHAMVLEKPFNQPVHPSMLHLTGTLGNGFCFLMQSRGENAIFRPVNRLDRNTSGLVLCAMNAYAAPLLAKSAQKVYTAVVQGEMPLGKGVVTAPIGREDGSIITRCVSENGQYACTEYNVIKSGGGLSVVECVPVTGRTHQIRVHMAHINHPLAGDDLYGGSKEKITRHALHCSKISFVNPVNNVQIKVESTLPYDMNCLVKATEIV